MGASVILTSSSDEKLEFGKKLGATHTINYKTTPDWDSEVLKVTGGRGADHILEVGGAKTLLQSTNAIRYGGTIHVVGFIAGVSSCHQSGRSHWLTLGCARQQYSQDANVDLSRLPILLLGKGVILRTNLIGPRVK